MKLNPDAAGIKAQPADLPAFSFFFFVYFYVPVLMCTCGTTSVRAFMQSIPEYISH